MEKVYIGLIGLGTVGGSVAKVLSRNAELITKRAGVEICIKTALVRDIAKYPNTPFALTHNLDDILEDEEISIVVELIGGVDYPFEIAQKVFAKNKAFVTANKAMLAYHMSELLQISKGLGFGFEASVCGGIPIIEALRDSLVANEILGFEGILNGTSNYILTQMLEKNMDFKVALQEAQELGYAEADPSLDINGGDAGHKLAILARLAYGIDVRYEDILVEGIEGVTLEDMQLANEMGYKIKLVGIASLEGVELDLRLHLALVSKHKKLSSVNGVTNAVVVYGDCIGEMFFCGLGAGGEATASAVIADIVSIARLRKTQPYLLPVCGFFDTQRQIHLKQKGDIQSQYYLRLVVLNRSGVLAQITSILAKYGISVSEILQRDKQEEAKVFLTTHKVQESLMCQAVQELAGFDFVLQPPYKIRIQ